MGVFLGYLGWTLPTVGGSLVTPTLAVFLVGAGIAGTSWVVACFRPHRRALQADWRGSVNHILPP